MKTNILKKRVIQGTRHQNENLLPAVLLSPESSEKKWFQSVMNEQNSVPEILVITSYPPRECGIATYSQDLITSLNNKFGTSFSIKVCAMESGKSNFKYSEDVKATLDTTNSESYLKLANDINKDNLIKMVLIQHEFGFFHKQKEPFLKFLYQINKPIITVFHTVLPNPNETLKQKVQNIASACSELIVMTNRSKQILLEEYDVPTSKINVIAHGTHLVPNLNKDSLKEKYNLIGKKVLTTFGLLSSGKSVETTLKALPEIIKTIPEVMFLIIGKTHPEVVKNDGEVYRDMLLKTVTDLKIQDHVRFINSYLNLPDLLEYLQLTDIYLFTTNDPNQAVSGTFAYAMSCGCPIISTPIPHAKEVLTKDTGIIIDFQNSKQLAQGVILLLGNDKLRNEISTNTLQKIVFTAWENSAVAHAKLFAKQTGSKISMLYNLPEIKLDHVERMTTEFGMIQFSKINQPDFDSGYTLDDNARALITVCQHYELTSKRRDLILIEKYLHFIKYCQQEGGNFLNYVDMDKQFTKQNYETNLDDANGRAIWALGYLISMKSVLPQEFSSTAVSILEKTFPHIETIHSTRAMAFIVKGMCLYYKGIGTTENVMLTERLANRMVEMYNHESTKNWEWFEGYLTYANSILPEAMLCAWNVTGKVHFKAIAKESFGFLLSQIFNENGIEVISNKSRFNKGQQPDKFGEQPIDVAYTIMTLAKFYDAFQDKKYLDKMIIAFNWFLGENRLNQIIYNPCTGGCYDGLEEFNINLNQGAESTVSYLMARLTMEKYINEK